MNTLALALSLRDYTLFVAVMLLAILLLRKSLHDPATSVTLLMCSVAASFAYDIQHTDWPYHAYPHQALLELALAYLLIDLLCPVVSRLASDSRLINRMALVASALMAVLLCFIAVHPHILHSNPKRLEGNELDRILSQYKPSTTVYVFSTSEAAQASAYNHGLNWGSRFAHLWMLPAIIQNELGPTGPPAPFKRLPPEKLATLASLQRTESAEDLDYWRPSVVLVQQCTVERPCQGLDGKNFNMVPWFQQGPSVRRGMVALSATNSHRWLRCLPTGAIKLPALFVTLRREESHPSEKAGSSVANISARHSGPFSLSSSTPSHLQ